MKTTKLFLATLLLLPFFLLASKAEMPQDHWYFNGMTISGNFGALAIGPDGNLYAATNGGAISVFTTAGNFIRQFGSNLNVAGIALDSQTNIYVVDYTAAQRIKKFDSTGNLTWSFGGAGSGANQFNTGSGISRITIDNNDRIYIADSGNNRVQVVDTNGSVVQVWNDTVLTGDPYWFQKVAGIAAAPNGHIFTWSASAHMTLVWNSYGSWYSPDSVGTDYNPRGPAISVTPDGLIALLAPTRFEMYMAGQPNPVGWGSSGVPFTVSSTTAIAIDANSTIFISAQTPLGSLIFGMNRRFGHVPPNYIFVDASNQTNSTVPVPFIQSAIQRSNSTLVDIDYRVNDPDSQVVTVGLLAFRNSVSDTTESLTQLIKLTSFAENTETNLGPNQSANHTYRVTWDASEGSTNFANFQFLVLANDNRSLLDFRFITLPASGTNSVLTLSSDTVSDARLLGIWFWLIATSDPAITFTNGSVKGVGGAYDGQTLASGSSTTSQGRSFLYERLSVRAPTTGEITRAQSGNYGFSSVDANNVVKLP